MSMIFGVRLSFDSVILTRARWACEIGCMSRPHCHLAEIAETPTASTPAPAHSRPVISVSGIDRRCHHGSDLPVCFRHSILLGRCEVLDLPAAVKTGRRRPAFLRTTFMTFISWGRGEVIRPHGCMRIPSAHTSFPDFCTRTTSEDPRIILGRTEGTLAIA